VFGVFVEAGALAINAPSHIIHAPPTSPLHAFDVAGPGGAPIILAPRIPVPVGHPPPPATAPPPPAAAASMPPPPPPPTLMPQPSVVSFGDLPQPPLFIHYDPAFIASQQPIPTMHHGSAALSHPNMSTIAYVR